MDIKKLLLMQMVNSSQLKARKNHAFQLQLKKMARSLQRRYCDIWDLCSILLEWILLFRYRNIHTMSF